MIKNLLKQIWKQRTTNAWLWAELLIVSVCLWYITDYLYVTSRLYFSPLGYNIEHTYSIQLGLLESESNLFDEANRGRATRMDHLAIIADRVRSYQGVEAISFSSTSKPYGDSQNNGTNFIDTVGVFGRIYSVSTDFFRVFRITDKNGEVAPLVQAAQQGNTFIISEATEKEFLEKGVNPFHATLRLWDEMNKNQEGSHTVRAICKDVRQDEFNKIRSVYYQIRSDEQFFRGWGNHTEFCFRVDPAVDSPDFLNRFRKDMKEQFQVGNNYLIDIIPLSDDRDTYFRTYGSFNELKTKLAILFFLLINIFLGVVGTFWVRTQNRYSEIGLRLALGSSKSEIKFYLILEGIILLFLTLIPAALICYQFLDTNLIDSHRMDYTPGRFIITIGASYLFIAGMILVGIYIPARRASNIDPSEVLHEE